MTDRTLDQSVSRLARAVREAIESSVKAEVAASEARAAWEQTRGTEPNQVNCPNCGAPRSGKRCEYCGTELGDDDCEYEEIRDWTGEVVARIKRPK